MTANSHQFSSLFHSALISSIGVPQFRVDFFYSLVAQIPVMSTQMKRQANLCYYQSFSDMSEPHEDSRPELKITFTIHGNTTLQQLYFTHKRSMIINSLPQPSLQNMNNQFDHSAQKQHNLLLHFSDIFHFRV